MLRFATQEDVAQMLAIYAPYVQHTTYSFEYEVPDEEEFMRRFRTYTAQFPWLVWEEQGRVLGYAYGSAPFDRAAYGWCAESSIYLAPEAQGRGIGRKLNTALEQILEKQGYRVLYALVTTENEASLAFHRKLGFETTAVFPNCGWKFGRWLGVVWMEKRLGCVEFVENAPISWLSIGESAQFFSDILANLSLS